MIVPHSHQLCMKYTESLQSLPTIKWCKFYILYYIKQERATHTKGGIQHYTTQADSKHDIYFPADEHHIDKKKLIENPREWHSHKLQPPPDTKRIKCRTEGNYENWFLMFSMRIGMTSVRETIRATTTALKCKAMIRNRYNRNSTSCLRRQTGMICKTQPLRTLLSLTHHQLLVQLSSSRRPPSLHFSYQNSKKSSYTHITKLLIVPFSG